jgi:HK97 family phage major capsid protein
VFCHLIHGEPLALRGGKVQEVAKVLEFVTSVQAANADIGSMAWTMTARTAALFRRTLKTSTDTASNMLMGDDGTLAGFPVAITNAIPDAGSNSPSTESYVIFGAWSQLLIGYWSGVDILANPFESNAYQKARVLVRVMRDVDVAVRHPQSFAWSEDIESA